MPWLLVSPGIINELSLFRRFEEDLVANSNNVLETMVKVCSPIGDCVKVTYGVLFLKVGSSLGHLA